MNKQLQLMQLIGLVVLMTSCTASKQKPRLHIPKSRIDLATIKADSAYMLQYSLINTGTGVLSIDTVTASCGCTIPTATKYEIAPQDSVLLTVQFKPPDTGDFDKKLVIRSNTDSIYTVLSFYGKAEK
ncbi:MAG: DUF1573 domain-containing protein [Bacteroidetes bacterium]|nr:DUF1573 domain-containing protein [Bacteroidota bacterium]